MLLLHFAHFKSSSVLKNQASDGSCSMLRGHALVLVNYQRPDEKNPVHLTVPYDIHLMQTCFLFLWKMYVTPYTRNVYFLSFFLKVIEYFQMFYQVCFGWTLCIGQNHFF